VDVADVHAVSEAFLAMISQDWTSLEAAPLPERVFVGKA
jgi:hypothetical protein